MYPLNIDPVCLVPPQIQAAQMYLQFAYNLRNPIGSIDGTAPQLEDLTPKEQEVYWAALELMRSYFEGECNFVDGKPVQQKRKGGDGPTQLERVKR